jgi:hypothetical protein
MVVKEQEGIVEGFKGCLNQGEQHSVSLLVTVTVRYCALQIR